MLIQIRPPRASWPADFGRVKTALLPVLPSGAIVHHIGSTAVPGLAAKDIIDIQVTLARLTDLDATALTGAGFERASPTRDHQPPGMKLAAVDLAKQMFRAALPVANIHIRVHGRFNQRYPLLCRDYLRAHPLAAAAYGAIKQNLATRFPNDAEAYYDIKDPVFDLIMVGAEAWAAATGWTLPPGD
ncbi:MAG: GrpB family protein [bacterium]